MLKHDEIIWNEVGDTKVTKIDGITVSIPVDYAKPIPVFCECCEYPMRLTEDYALYEKNNCCSFCDLYFAKPNIEQWKLGWRPSKEQIAKIKMCQNEWK